MTAALVRGIVLTWIAAGLLLSHCASAQEVVHYSGTGEVAIGSDYSCYPDMAGPIDVDLLLNGSSGFLIVNPGIAIGVERLSSSAALTIHALPLGHYRTPFFLPKAIRIESDGPKPKLTIEWTPYFDCFASTTSVDLTAALNPNTPKELARQQRRSALFRAYGSAREPADRERTATELFNYLHSEWGPEYPETIEAAVELGEQRRAAKLGLAAFAPLRQVVTELDRNTTVRRTVFRAKQALCKLETDAQLWRDGLATCSQLVAMQSGVLHRLHEDVLTSLSYLADAHANTGDSINALEVGKDEYHRVLQRYEQDSARGADVTYRLFFRFHSVGRAVEALELAEQGYELRLKYHGADDPRTLDALNAIGVVNTSFLSRPEVALPIFREIRDRITRDGMPKTLGQLSSVSFNLANTLYRSRMFKEALEMAREAEQISRQAFAPNARQRYSPVVVQIRSLEKLGRHEEALALARQSLAEVEANASDDLYGVGRAVQLVAERLSTARDPEALSVWERAYILFKKSMALTDTGRMSTLEQYSYELERNGKHAEAMEIRRELVVSVEALVAQGSALGDARASAFKPWSESYRRLARNLLDENHTEEALEITERAKSRLLLESIALRGAADTVGMTTDERVQLSRLRDQLQRADQRLAAADASARTKLEIERNRTGRELDAHVKALRDRYPRFARLTDIQPATSSAARAVLPRDAVLLNFVVGQQDLLLFAIARDRPLIALARALPAGLRESVNAYRLSLLPQEQRQGLSVWQLQNGSFTAATSRPDNAISAIKEHEVIGRWLAQNLLEPLADVLRGYQNWIISPDSDLAHLPFETLPWNGGRVIDQKQVSTTQSVSVYVLGRQASIGGSPKTRLNSSSNWLGLGAPDYSLLNRGLNLEETAPTRVSGLRSLRQQATLRTEFEPLPNARQELQWVSQSFKQSTLIVGAEATEQRFRRLDQTGELSRFKILHLAAHGFVHPQQPALSAVVLGADDNATTDSDGFVTAAEWTALTLNSELIVLSACETALGPAVSGEGVLGLPYALFVAGNRNAVLTMLDKPTLNPRVIRLHAADNLVVAVDPIPPGSIVQGVAALARVPRGHKMAMVADRRG